MARIHALASALLLAAPLHPLAARADTITVGLQEAGYNGGSIVTETSGDGSAVFSGAYGAFTLNTIIATGSPFITEPNFDSASINVTGSGTLFVYVTESGLTTPTGSFPLASAFTSNVFNGGATSVVETTLASTTDALYAGIALASATFTGQGTKNVVSMTPAISGPYSLTEEYQITAVGPGDVNDTVDLAAVPVPVPEPASAALLGAALVGAGLLGSFGQRRRG